MSFTFGHVLMGLTILGILAFAAYYIYVLQPRRGTIEWIDRTISTPRFRFSFTLYKMEKRDALPLLIIIIVFTFLGFFMLGDTDAPQTFHQFTADRNSVTLTLPKTTTVDKVMAYTGLNTGSYNLWYSMDGVDWEQVVIPAGDDGKAKYPLEQTHADLFKWREFQIPAPFIANYIFIGAIKTPIELGELAIYDQWGALVKPAGVHALFDEQATIPEEGPTYLNGMYFDEIYHGRAAMETLRSIYPYETVHPPLGKTLIAVGVSFFGMTPFGWRFVGTLFGIAMLAVLYVLLKNMFGKTMVATCGTLLFGFEFMRFVQTRIATVDTYPVFFIIVSFLFMYRFLTTTADKPTRETLQPLGFSGLFFGIGVATKWIVIYAGLGLLALYIIKLVTDYFYYYKPENRRGYTVRVIKTLLFTALTFIIVPVIIYILSYIPYGQAKGMQNYYVNYVPFGKGVEMQDYFSTFKNGGFVRHEREKSTGLHMLLNLDYYKMVIDVQLRTFKYHSALVADHPYSSWWYQWVVNQRPILYYLRYMEDGKRSAFAAFGNPVVWWGGIVAIIVVFIRSISFKFKHKWYNSRLRITGLLDARALIILIGFFAQLVPWMFVSRIVFAYHYFPSTVFLVLALAYMFDTIYDRTVLPKGDEPPKPALIEGEGFDADAATDAGATGLTQREKTGKRVIIAFTAASGVLFALFYPVLTGVPMKPEFLRQVLKWLPSWPF